MQKNLVLPWPPAVLSPNSRAHWAALARAKKAYRTACGWEARAQGLARYSNSSTSETGAVLVSVKFCPPDKRHRDFDNALSALKSGFDGLVDVLGIDDSKWILQLHRGWGQVVKGGQVQITLEI